MSLRNEIEQGGSCCPFTVKIELFAAGREVLDASVILEVEISPQRNRVASLHHQLAPGPTATTSSDFDIGTLQGDNKLPVEDGREISVRQLHYPISPSCPQSSQLQHSPSTKPLAALAQFTPHASDPHLPALRRTSNGRTADGGSLATAAEWACSSWSRLWASSRYMGGSTRLCGQIQKQSSGGGFRERLLSCEQMTNPFSENLR